MICCRKEMSWMVLYLSGRGRLMSLRYKMRRSLPRGRRTRPVLVLTGLPHIWLSFWIAFSAVVCALQLTVAVVAPRSSEKHCSSRTLLPQPSGPTSSSGSPRRSQAAMKEALRRVSRVTMSLPEEGTPTPSSSSPRTMEWMLAPGGVARRSPSLVRRARKVSSSSRTAGSMLDPSPLASPMQNSCLVPASCTWLRHELTNPSLLDSTAAGWASAHSSALWK
mmetsp:Transcript_33184/g.84793  ORF Transcript_33184/g.84793 Transcript_33184/m.84793 type:complete len:221 (-) Transcript_33184:144-806(-)